MVLVISLLCCFLTTHASSIDFSPKDWFDYSVTIKKRVWWVKEFDQEGDCPYGACFKNSKDQRFSVHFNGGHHSGIVSTGLEGVSATGIYSYLGLYFPKDNGDAVRTAVTYQTAVADGTTKLLVYYNVEKKTICYGLKNKKLYCLKNGVDNYY